MADFYGKKHKTKCLIFYIIMLAFPVLQFCVFYIGVNFNSIKLAFSRYDYDKGVYKLVGFDNFEVLFKSFAEKREMLVALRNSVTVFLLNLVFGTALGVVFSYYIFRKMAGGKVFKIMLFLPSILSSMVLAVMFKYFSERAIPFAVDKYFHKSVEGLIANVRTTFPTIIAFSIFVGFGSSVLMYVGAMGNISDSTLEAARIDGASPTQEFLRIVVPMIFPTITSFVVVSTAGIFTNQICLYNFFGPDAEPAYQTIGYYLYKSTQIASIGEYPSLAAFGIICTVVAVPLTIGVRRLLEKIGPSVE